MMVGARQFFAAVMSRLAALPHSVTVTCVTVGREGDDAGGTAHAHIDGFVGGVYGGAAHDL